MKGRASYLVVRRDNIGDLVLTTPLIHALRQHRPDAWIGALANSYNAPVLNGNPDLDAVFAYDKAKHRPDRSRLAVYRDTLRLLLSLRGLRIDTVILAGPGAQRQAYQLARWLRPAALLGFVTPDFAPAGITLPVDYGNGAALHEAEDIFRLLAPLGIDSAIPPTSVHADQTTAKALRPLVQATLAGAKPWIAVQISARRIKQRWPIAKFAELMQQINAAHGAGFLLFWSPGAADDERHPGDDARVRELIGALPAGFPVFAHATHHLDSLIAGLSLADGVITPDGGAMHLAAALGKPVVALFGDAPVARWRPWRVEHEVVQAASGDVVDVPVSAVVTAWNRLAPRVLPV